jgi:hypothetical protein
MSDHLRALDPDDLVVLLQRRPEARQLLERRRRDFAALADALAAPTGIHIAAASLNGFLTQLLQLALWLGPEAPAGALQEHAPGVRPEDLRAGAEELARWGLAFVEDRPGAGWVLQVPAATMAAVVMPTGFGPLARRLFESKTVEFLAAVAGNLGLPPRPHSGKSSMIAEIAAALADPRRVDALLEAAPRHAQELFDRIRVAGGQLSRHEMMLSGAIRWSDPAWSERRKVLTPLDWLEAHGLVVLDAAVAYTGAMAIPGEVELALRGGQLFGEWPAPVPPPLATASGHAGEAGDPSKILAELETLLEAWTQARPVTLQKGGLGVRELRKSARTLGFPEAYVHFLYALAVGSGLAGVDADGRVQPAPAAQAWAESPAPVRWSLLWRTWLDCGLWTEESDDGLVALDQAHPSLWIHRLRRGAIEALARLAPGESTTPEALGAVLAWTYPTLLPGGPFATTLARRIAQALTWLGTATGPATIRLVEPGRSATTSASWVEEGLAGTGAFAPEVATCTVGADLCVIVPGPPVHALAAGLGRFADLKASSPARIYQLSEASLRRALDTGMAASEIRSLLERHATKGIPQNVAYLIDDIARRHGHLVTGTAGLYLRSDDPALLAGAVADRRLASFSPRLIAPTVAVLAGSDVAPLLAALRSAGYLPVAEDAGGLIQAPPPAAEVRPMVRAGSPLHPLSAGEARELARALHSSRTAMDRTRVPAPGLPPLPPGSPLRDRRERRDPRAIRALLDEAADWGGVVEISYLSSNGRRTRRTIEPQELTHTHVLAWCRLRDDERHFALARIESARPTGERIDIEALLSAEAGPPTALVSLPTGDPDGGEPEETTP